MRKLAQLLLIISCISYAYDDSMLTEVNKNKSCSTSSCFDFNAKCCPGPRGKRGHRGHRGLTGVTGVTGSTGATGATGSAAAAGVNELFLNALMMTHSSGEGIIPINFFDPYGLPFNSAPIAAWIMQFRNDIVGVNFNIPDDLDNTQPVNVVLYFLVPNSGGLSTGNQAKILLQADYKFSGGLVGVEAPATGFVTSSVSPDFTIIEPAVSVPNNSNLVIISVTIPLDPTFIAPGQWTFFQLARILPASNDYSFPIYLSDLSFQYSRI